MNIFKKHKLTLSTRQDIKKSANKWGWRLLSEGDGGIAFLLKSGKTLAVKYDIDTDKLIKINDTANAVMELPLVFDETEESEE